MSSGQPGMGQGYGQQQQGFDTTGQLAPAGMKPRVTATLWEDEGSLCFQVEAKGVCVARREGRRASFTEDRILVNVKQIIT
jgi:protein SOK2